MESRSRSGVGQLKTYKSISKVLFNFKVTIQLSTLIGVIISALYLWKSVPIIQLKHVCNYGFLYFINSVYQTKDISTKLLNIENQIGLYSEIYTFAIVIFTIVFALAFVALSYLFYSKDKSIIEDRYIRGSKLITAADLSLTLSKRPTSEEGRYSQKIGTDGVIIPEDLTYRGFALCGRPGKRKTTLINYMIEQQVANGGKGFVLDINGTYYSKFGRPNDKILSLRDKRSEYWDFWSEDVSPSLYASYLIEKGGQENQFFWRSARSLISTLIRVNNSVDSLWSDLSMPTSDLIRKLDDLGEIVVKTIGGPSSNQAAGVVGTATLGFSYVRELGYWGTQNGKSESPFSFNRWANSEPDDDSWVYLIVRDDEIEELSSLIGMWFNLGIQACLRRDEDLANQGKYKSIMFVLDELKSLGRLSELEKGAERLRKYLAYLVLGYQNNAQIEAIYGNKPAANLKDVLQNKVIYAVGEPSAQRECSQILGEQEVEETTKGEQFDSNKISGLSHSNRVTRKSIVLPSEIGGLADGEIYLKVESYNPCKTYIEWKSWPKINQSIVHGTKPRTQKECHSTLNKPTEDELVTSSLVQPNEEGLVGLIDNDQSTAE